MKRQSTLKIALQSVGMGISLVAILHWSHSQDGEGLVVLPQIPIAKNANLNEKSEGLAGIAQIPFAEWQKRSDSAITRTWLSDLASDELQDQKIFLNLSSFSPLENMAKLGVQSFERKTFRSSGYLQSSGYDVVTYELQFGVSRSARILAYVEGGEGHPAVTHIFVLEMASPTHATLSHYENDALVGVEAVDPSDAKSKLALITSQATNLLRASVP